MVSTWICHWLNWQSIGLGYEVFPPSLARSLPPSSTQEKLTGLTPVLPHLSYTGYTHIPPLTLLSSGREMDSYCLPECTTYLWMWFSLTLLLFSFPLFRRATRVPFCFHRKMPRPHCKVHKTHSRVVMIEKWAEIPSELIFYMTTWIRSKSETHDGPNLFKTNHSHPWNPQERKACSWNSFIAGTHTHTAKVWEAVV